MLRRKLVVPFVSLMAAGMLPLGAAPAFADPAPCPSAFSGPIPVAPGDESHDRNENGLVCFKLVGGQGGNSVIPGVTVTDDKPGDVTT